MVLEASFLLVVRLLASPVSLFCALFEVLAHISAWTGKCRDKLAQRLECCLAHLLDTQQEAISYSPHAANT